MQVKIRQMSLALLILGIFSNVNVQAREFSIPDSIGDGADRLGPSPDEIRGREAEALRQEMRVVQARIQQTESALAQADSSLRQENVNFQNFKSRILRTGAELREDLNIYHTHQDMLSNVMRRNSQEVEKIQESLVKIDQVSRVASVRLAILPDDQPSTGIIEILSAAIDPNILQQEPGLVQGLRSFSRAKLSMKQTIQNLASAVHRTSAQTSESGLHRSLTDLQNAQQQQFVRANELKAGARATSESVFELITQVEKEN